MVHRISDLLGHQSAKDKSYKHPDKQTDKQQVIDTVSGLPDLTLIQDSNIADSGVNLTEGDFNTETPMSTISYSFDSCESPYSTFSFNSTPFTTESWVNLINKTKN
jgi:hypothetical protein